MKKQRVSNPQRGELHRRTSTAAELLTMADHAKTLCERSTAEGNADLAANLRAHSAWFLQGALIASQHPAGIGPHVMVIIERDKHPLTGAEVIRAAIAPEPDQWPDAPLICGPLCPCRRAFEPSDYQTGSTHRNEVAGELRSGLESGTG